MKIASFLAVGLEHVEGHIYTDQAHIITKRYMISMPGI